jgi:hypothetical protein
MSLWLVKHIRHFLRHTSQIYFFLLTSINKNHQILMLWNWIADDGHFSFPFFKLHNSFLNLWFFKWFEQLKHSCNLGLLLWILSFDSDFMVEYLLKGLVIFVFSEECIVKVLINASDWSILFVITHHKEWKLV